MSGDHTKYAEIVHVNSHFNPPIHHRQQFHFHKPCKKSRRHPKPTVNIHAKANLEACSVAPSNQTSLTLHIHTPEMARLTKQPAILRSATVNPFST